MRQWNKGFKSNMFSLQKYDVLTWDKRWITSCVYVQNPLIQLEDAHACLHAHAESLTTTETTASLIHISLLLHWGPHTDLEHSHTQQRPTRVGVQVEINALFVSNFSLTRMYLFFCSIMYMHGYIHSTACKGKLFEIIEITVTEDTNLSSKVIFHGIIICCHHAKRSISPEALFFTQSFSTI